MKRIYLDTAASTPLGPQTAQLLHRAERYFGNPSSLHQEGMAAAKALAAARSAAAQILACRPEEIIFTSGGTEANNLAIAGAPRGGIAVSAIEHASILEPAQRRGEVTILPVNAEGLLDLKLASQLITSKTKLVSMMLANNEIGTIQPIKEIAKIIRRLRKQNQSPFPYLHTDACQATRFIDLNVQKLGVDLLTLNGGKIYGPKGAGLLYVRKGIKLNPQVLGGGQEGGFRSGTENVPLILGLVDALVKAAKLREKESQKLIKLRDDFIKNIEQAIPSAMLNGSRTERLPNNINFSFPGILAEQLAIELDAKGFAVSTGSACSVPKHNSSYVIMALGANADRATSAIRISLDRETKQADLNLLVKTLTQITNQLINANHVYAADLKL